MPNADITKRAIADTMKTLMANEPLTKISVGDIANACGITRNSFYYHFQDKFDLINWIFYTEITQTFNQEDIENLDSWEMIKSVCMFFYDRKGFYQNALSVSGQNSFVEYFNELLQKWGLMRIGDIFVDDEDREFLTLFFSNAFVDAISRWILGGAKIPPDKFSALMKKVTIGAAIRIAEKEGEALK